MNYEEIHQAWIQDHLNRRKGERRSRLERGHGHGERLFLKQVWWPLRRNFDHLHPEYEVLDWRNRSYFADFAWIPGNGVKLIFEIKGYNIHVRDMDRTKYCNELNRETFLYGMGFDVNSFAYDDVERRPELCITLLRLVLGRFQPEKAPVQRAILLEKEIIRLTIQLAGSVRPIDVEHHLEVDHKTAVRLLQSLCKKGWLVPHRRGESQRITSYELARGGIDYFS